MQQLYSHQREGIAWLTEGFEAGRDALALFDDMGLGKTLQAIEVSKRLLAGADTAAKTLIICPATLRLNWKAELEKWSMDSSVVVMATGKQMTNALKQKSLAMKQKSLAMKQKSLEFDYYITSYGLATSGIDELINHKWSFLILDEAHSLKNKTSARTKAILYSLWNHCERKLLLTGTPCPNGIIDGYELFRALLPNEPNFLSRYRYGMTFTNVKPNRFSGGYNYVGGKNISRLKQILDPVMLRRRKATTLDLPEKIYSTIPISISRPQDYQLSEETLNLVLQGKHLVGMDEHVATTRRGLGLAKIPQIIKHVSMHLETGRKRVVVFTYHKAVIDLLAKELSKKAKILCIHGGVSASKKQALVDEFQTKDPEQKIMLAQIQSAGVGITLHAASLCLIAELSFVPAEIAQAIDRLHRIGQRECVNIEFIVAENTMDSQIIRSLRTKIESIKELLGERSNNDNC